MTVEELIDFVQQDLTMSCMLPKILPDREVRRLIVDVAQRWFYENYFYSVEKIYTLVTRDALQTDPATKYKYVKMPCDVQSVTWLYPITDNTLFRLGIAAPNLSLNLGVTNQPYLSSFTTTVGELGVYKVIIDSFADVLNQLSKHTLKYDYNFHNNRLHVLTSVDTNIIAEVYAKISPDDLYQSEMFRRYVVAIAREQQGRALTRFSYNLPGNVQVNGDSMLSEGAEMRKQIEEEVKKMPNTGFFFMVKR